MGQNIENILHIHTHILYFDKMEANVNNKFKKNLYNFYISYDNNTFVQVQVVNCMDTFRRFWRKSITHSPKHLKDSLAHLMYLASPSSVLADTEAQMSTSSKDSIDSAKSV